MASIMYTLLFRKFRIILETEFDTSWIPYKCKIVFYEGIRTFMNNASDVFFNLFKFILT